MRNERLTAVESKTALVLAAHGSPVEHQVNRDITAIADRIRQQGKWREVITAFHHGTPNFLDSLLELSSASVVVVPLLTSKGYFYERVKQTFESAAQARSDLHLVVAAPVGTHDRVAKVISTRVQSLIQRFLWSLSDVGVLIVGHGTRRHGNSRNATVELTRQLDDLWRKTQKGSAAKPVAAFLDDDPDIESAVGMIEQDRLVLLPFLISNGPHARTDIPASLGLGKKENPDEPWLVDLTGRQCVIDIPFGSLPEVEKLIVQRALEALRRLDLPTEENHG